MNFFSKFAYGRTRQESMSIGEYKRQIDSKSIKVPEFQRKFVWTPTLKQRYLVTLSKRGPIYGFILNHHTENGTYDLIDGQNRSMTIYDFMRDKIKFEQENGEGGLIYSKMDPRDREIFERIRINYVLAEDWDDDDCQEYFRTIQEGMKLTHGEKIHSAHNNIFQQKIVHIATKYHDILTEKRKKGGFDYKIKRYVHYEVIGCLLKCFMEEDYYDRPGQVAFKELTTWDDFPKGGDLCDDLTVTQAATRLSKLEEAVKLFEKILDYYIILRKNCDSLNSRQYTRDSTFIRNMYFIFHNKLHKDEVPSEDIIKFNEMMNVILDKNTKRHDMINLWGTQGKMDKIMDEYKRVYDDHLSPFVNHEYLEEEIGGDLGEYLDVEFQGVDYLVQGDNLLNGSFEEIGKWDSVTKVATFTTEEAKAKHLAEKDNDDEDNVA